MPTQRNAHNDSAYSAWYITACIVVLSAIIGTAGYTYLQQQKQLVISEATLDLTTIVDLKVSQMVEWRKERIREATAIHSNTIISHHIKNHLKHKRTKNIKEISDWISGVQNSTGYKNILLFTPDGEVVTSALPLTKALSGDSGIIKDTVLKKEVLLSDLHIHEDAGEFDINLVIPILDPDSDSHECIAVLSIDINPLIHLYPLFRSWPTPSRTGENLLVRHDGNDVLFLNELRFRGKSAITFRQSLTKKDTPAARAALGEEGVFKGLDYRDTEVIAAVRAVPNSTWAIISKEDLSEILEPVVERVWYVIGTCLVILIALGLAVIVWLRRKRVSYLTRLYEAELKFNSEMKQAEQALLESNIHLEERVKKRTEELSDAVTQLKQEIAERKQVEDLLRKHFQAILQSPVAIIITDLAGNIEFINPKFTEYSGYSYEESIGQNPRILKSDSAPPIFYKRLWDTITAGKVWKGEFCNRRKNGELFWEYAKILPIKDQDGTITNYMAFKEDITLHKQLEEKLIKSRKMETIGQIAGGVAHEVRNPLNAILSITEALFKEKEIESNPEYEPYIKHIRTQVNRLVHLMNELLDLGKATPTSSIKSLPLLEVCQEAVNLWKSSGTQGKIALDFTPDADLEQIFVRADSGRLIQVLFNLLENAAQHSPDNSHIVLNVSASEATPCSMATVRITDVGKGIPEDRLNRVFDPFYTSRKDGTGLGLALVKHFIEDMSGSVVLSNNNPPPGCTAQVNIPLSSERIRETHNTAD